MRLDAKALDLQFEITIERHLDEELKGINLYII